MGSAHMSWRRYGAAAVVALLVVGCSSSGATWPALRPSGLPSPPAVGSGGPAPSGAHVEIPVSTALPTSNVTEPPRATVAPATVDQITATYTYRDTLITPLAHLYGKELSGSFNGLDDFVIVTIQNDNAEPVKVVVESQVINYTDKSTDTVDVDANSSAEVRQNPRLTSDAIDNLNSSHDADLHVVVSYLDNGEPKTVLDQTSTTTVTSRRDFPWKINGYTDQQIYEMLAVMVTPTDPGVEELISDAKKYDPEHAMTGGYESDQDSDGSVYQRLADIWQAEATDYGLSYVSTTVSFEAATQRIRLPSEVLTQSGGNCIETSLLYASVAEALNMDSVVILIPGHAFVGISLDSTDESFYFIETTAIGAATFDDAVQYAGQEWQDAEPHLQAGDAQYGFLNVAQARADGITPIPWH